MGIAFDQDDPPSTLGPARQEFLGEYVGGMGTRVAPSEDQDRLDAVLVFQAGDSGDVIGTGPTVAAGPTVLLGVGSCSSRRMVMVMLGMGGPDGGCRAAGSGREGRRCDGMRLQAREARHGACCCSDGVDDTWAARRSDLPSDVASGDQDRERRCR